MKSISFNKTLCFTKSSIEIRYNGILPNDNVDLDKIEILLEDFINNHRHDNMIENVTIVRTILNDCKEKLLVIFYQDDKGSELVKYVNSNLFLYEKSKGGENSERCKIKYEPSYGIKLDYNNHEINIVDYSGIELVSKEITKMMKQIYCLNDAKPVILNKDDKAIIEIYKLFYNKNPNFSSKDINIKVQTMMSILASFGVSLGDDYEFKLWEKVKMPTSITLKQLVNKLYPLGEVSSVENNINLTDESKKIIKIIGECIREKIYNEQSKNETLIAISKIIHVDRYNLPSSCDVKKLSECSTDEIETSIKLVKRIENRINKQIK